MNGSDVLFSSSCNSLMRDSSLLRNTLKKIFLGRIGSLEDCLSGDMRPHRAKAFQVIKLFGFLRHFWTAESQNCRDQTDESIWVGKVGTYLFVHFVGRIGLFLCRVIYRRSIESSYLFLFFQSDDGYGLFIKRSISRFSCKATKQALKRTFLATCDCCRCSRSPKIWNRACLLPACQS